MDSQKGTYSRRDSDMAAVMPDSAAPNAAVAAVVSYQKATKTSTRYTTITQQQYIPGMRTKTERGEKA